MEREVAGMRRQRVTADSLPSFGRLPVRIAFDRVDKFEEIFRTCLQLGETMTCVQALGMMGRGMEGGGWRGL